MNKAIALALLAANELLETSKEDRYLITYRPSFDIPEFYPSSPKIKGKVEPIRDSTVNPKISRNSLCTCGSNIKYKYCCINKNN